MCKFNVDNKREVIKLKNSKRFPKYPTMLLSNTCEVRVNGDEYLGKDIFTIYSKYRILPKKLYLYGKKTTTKLEEDNIYLNYWLEIFLKTVEKGNLCKHDFEKCNSKLDLCVGLPLDYRSKAFGYCYWTRENVIEFLSCLFDSKIEEVGYQQQDLLEDLIVA